MEWDSKTEEEYALVYVAVSAFNYLYKPYFVASFKISNRLHNQFYLPQKWRRLSILLK